jgi:hypothetical protein
MGSILDEPKEHRPTTAEIVARDTVDDLRKTIKSLQAKLHGWTKSVWYTYDGPTGKIIDPQIMLDAYGTDAADFVRVLTLISEMLVEVTGQESTAVEPPEYIYGVLTNADGTMTLLSRGKR